MSRTIIATTFFTVLVARQAAGANALYFTSSPASWVGHGRTEIFTPANGQSFSGFRRFNEGDDSNEVNLTVRNGTELWSLDVVGPNTTLVSVGSYSDALRWPFNGSHPGLDFSGDGRGSGTLSGSFQILEAAFTSGGQLSRIAVDFIQYDSKLTSEWNIGSWRFNSDIPITPIPEPSAILLVLPAFAAFRTRRRKSVPQDRV